MNVQNGYKPPKNEYCTNTVNNSDYIITTEILRKSIKKLQDNKAPGNDLIIGYYKHLSFYDDELSSFCLTKHLMEELKYQNGLLKQKLHYDRKTKRQKTQKTTNQSHSKTLC